MGRVLDLSPDRVTEPVPCNMPLTDWFGWMASGAAREVMLGDTEMSPEMADRLDASILDLCNDYALKLDRIRPSGLASAKGITLGFICTLLRECEQWQGVPDVMAKAALRIRIMVSDGRLVETCAYPQVMGVGKVRPGRVIPVRRLEA